MRGQQNKAQGKPQAKDSSGNGANWDTGIASDPSISTPYAVNSRLFFEGTVTATDMSRASDTREKGRIGITGSSQAYGGSNGRVTSESIGRDVNPLGRGGGAALIGGMMNIGMLAPMLPGGRGEVNQGNSVNNACTTCGGTAQQAARGQGALQMTNYYSDRAKKQCCDCIFTSFCCESYYASAPAPNPAATCCCPKQCTNLERNCYETSGESPDLCLTCCDAGCPNACVNLYTQSDETGNPWNDGWALAKKCVKNHIEILTCMMRMLIALATCPYSSDESKEQSWGLHLSIWKQRDVYQCLENRLNDTKVWKNTGANGCCAFGFDPNNKANDYKVCCNQGSFKNKHAITCYWTVPNTVVFCSLGAPGYSGGSWTQTACSVAHQFIHEGLHLCGVEDEWIGDHNSKPFGQNLNDVWAGRTLLCCGCELDSNLKPYI